MAFSPDDTGIANGNYFGFPNTACDSALVLLSAPWDVTVSYREGTARGPQAIIGASTQVEIYDPHHPSAWEQGIATIEPEPWIAPSSERYRQTAIQIIEHIEQGGDIKEMQAQLDEVNTASEKLNTIIYDQANELLDQYKIVGLVGGDHSTPLGLIRALASRNDAFGILHIDAHCDLRNAYEGFEYSHASIMHNALKMKQVSRLVQVGIRDFSHGEITAAKADNRIVQYPNAVLQAAAFHGENWHTQCESIISSLPYKVYISFDIDGLSPDLCPSTGTPVPGGLSFDQAVYLIQAINHSGRMVIGFDLTEVTPSAMGDWDQNVGARILYKLCNVAMPRKK